MQRKATVVFLWILIMLAYLAEYVNLLIAAYTKSTVAFFISIAIIVAMFLGITKIKQEFTNGKY